MAPRLEHVGIPVRSIERSKALYCDLLGYRPFFEVTVDLPHFARIVFLRKRSSRIELQEMRGDQWAATPTGRVGGLLHVSFAVDDLDGEVQRWTAAGQRLSVPPHHPGVMLPAEEHWRRAVFEGPDGELIELRGP